MDTRHLLGVVAVLVSFLVVFNLKGAFNLTVNDTSPFTVPVDDPTIPIVKRVPVPFSTATTTTTGITNTTPPRRRRIVLVHVGKTGGETVRHTLKITCKMRKNPSEQQACWDTFSNNTTESALSRHVIGTLHCNLLLPSDSSLVRATTLLWTMRNPVDRIVSWYHYMNPANCLPKDDYHSTACNTNRSIIATTNGHTNKKGSKWPTKFFICFPTLNDFAEALVIPGEVESSSSSCSQIAWRTIAGKASTSSGHAYYNYRYYWNETMAKYPTKEVWVLRTETLWEDMAAIEETLSQGNNVAPVSSSHPFLVKRNVTHGSEGHVQRDRLSSRGLARLCCALRDEIVVYSTILQQSTNLEIQERKKAISLILDQCLFAINASTSTTIAATSPLELSAIGLV